MSIIRCDKCKKEFEMESRVKKEGDIEINYFTCPHCKKQYTFLRTNSIMRRLIKQGKTRVHLYALEFRKLNKDLLEK